MLPSVPSATTTVTNCAVCDFLGNYFTNLYPYTEFHIVTGNDVTSCFQLAANCDNMQMFCKIFGHDFSISAKLISKVLTVLKRMI